MDDKDNPPKNAPDPATNTLPDEKKLARPTPHRYHTYEQEQLHHTDTEDTEDDDDDNGSLHSNDPSEHDGHRPCSCRRLSISSHQTRRASLALARTATGVSLSRTETVLSAIRSRRAVPPFTHPLAQQPTGPSVLVDFEGPDDPYRPRNWPTRKKVMTTLLYGLVTMSSTWSSAAFAAGTEDVAREFHVSLTTATLGTTLFMLGFGIGPLLWAPISEMYGRRLAVMIPVGISICFTFATATAKDFQTLMLCRFWAAFFASAPVTNTGGVLGDIFTPEYRGIAMAGYAMSVVGGPSVGPIVSAALTNDPSLGWRWCHYLSGIIQCFMLTMAMVFVDETYPPVLLVYKARRLRLATGNWALHAEFEEWDPAFKLMAKKFLLRPIQLLFTPICFMMSLYASFCYGIVYMQLGAIPLIFQGARGWGPVRGVFPFFGILIGAVCGASLNVLNQGLYNQASKHANGKAIPEKRLPPMMLGCWLFSGGLFLTCWTGDSSIHWIVPCFGLVMLGTGFFTIFQAALNYLVDTFQNNAASAIAATTFLRSIMAGAFPLVVRPMYNNLGIGPGGSIAAGFAALMIPVPYIFYVIGERVRAGSKWSKASVK